MIRIYKEGAMHGLAIAVGPRDGTRRAFPARTLFGAVGSLNELNETIVLELAEHSYSPKINAPIEDWVASVAVPALLAYRSRCAARGGRVQRFCTIGTGAGTDALAAIEIFCPSEIVLTDLHGDVVDRAVSNVLANLRDPGKTRVIGRTGDLAEPVSDFTEALDLIYENLPNIPLPASHDLLDGMNSSTFVVGHERHVPAPVERDLLALHFLFLSGASSLLAPRGRVLCSIGARRPLNSILSMPALAGFSSELLIYTWKAQSEAEEVIAGYAAAERLGHGPFHFYPVRELAQAFRGLPYDMTWEVARELEKRLQPLALSTHEAEAARKRGKPVGHTVAVIEAKRTEDQPRP